MFSLGRLNLHKTLLSVLPNAPWIIWCELYGWCEEAVFPALLRLWVLFAIPFGWFSPALGSFCIWVFWSVTQVLEGGPCLSPEPTLHTFLSSTLFCELHLPLSLNSISSTQGVCGASPQFPLLCCGLRTFLRVSWVVVGPATVESYVSGITALCWLMSSVLKTFALYILSSLPPIALGCRLEGNLIFVTLSWPHFRKTTTTVCVHMCVCIQGVLCIFF